MKKDLVNNPDHYTTWWIECLDAIQESMSIEAFNWYLKWNIQKYLRRYEKKDKPQQDLLKAQFYLNKLISLWDQS